MVASTTLKLVTDIGRKICILSVLATLLMHPAINTKSGVLLGEAATTDFDEIIERELLELWAFGGLVTFNTPYAVYGDAAYASHQFALESLAGHLPYFDIDGTETGYRLVGEPTGSENEAEEGFAADGSFSIPGIDIQDISVHGESLSDIRISMHIGDLFDDLANELATAGFTQGNVRDYRVAFTLENEDTKVAYAVSASRALQFDELNGWTMSPARFTVGVLANDGLFKTIEEIEGYWDARYGITWVVPFDLLNVARAPASLTDEPTVGGRVGPGATIGDVAGRVSTILIGGLVEEAPYMMNHVEALALNDYNIGSMRATFLHAASPDDPLYAAERAYRQAQYAGKTPGASIAGDMDEVRRRGDGDSFRNAQ